jgi:hypothetical protein
MHLSGLRIPSLTKAQLRTELGADLLSICESVTTDGRLTPEDELSDLKGLCKDVSGLGQWGNGDIQVGLKREVKISSARIESAVKSVA